jgi:soluble lytic murein transglycosylase
MPALPWPAAGRNVDALVNAVPNSLKDNPGLLYDRARWRRTHGNQDGAIPLLTQIDGKDVPAAGRSKLWKERSIAMRTDLKDGNWSRAYQLASPHGMTSGGDFAEAEWVSGWIALRLKGEPERALQHFETMADGVSTPISLSRGQYWTGRAEDALGEDTRSPTGLSRRGKNTNSPIMASSPPNAWATGRSSSNLPPSRRRMKSRRSRPARW